ncbi:MULTISPECIES: hemerythrin domain-containing protein [unclassified Lentimicrobium]|uniref:hemerythrin domain-containing protein n=1 Tax=unclassified Lentimicrobium TaxID=2677434 RepID=UPI001551BCE0|nr:MULTISPECIES: hemerythrin domain-containing protein [unclassified Lentimicrobium]NPD45336.1 hypothetical protein [Lentimicrobium sp. S6]NPD84365.1 hypothetical protein [Lentimicrobium sp. L6]
MVLPKIIKRTWNDAYLVGITSVDKQHEELLDIHDEIRDLSDTRVENHKEGLKKILQELEKLTEKYASVAPELLDHDNQTQINKYVSSYQDFIRKVDEFGRAYTYRNTFLLKDMQDYIKKWTISHIMQARTIRRQIKTNK